MTDLVPLPGDSWSAGKTLVVDSNDRAGRRSAQFLERAGYEVHRFRDEDGAYNLIDTEEVHNLIAEVRSPRIDGIRLVNVARSRNPELCAVLIAGPGDIELATRAVVEGAHDFQIRPLNLEKLVAVVRQAERRRALVSRVHELEQRLDRKYGLENLVGNSAAIISAVTRVRQVAPTQATVLVRGESGTGKGMLARVIHQHSSRKDGPLFTLDCAGQGETTIQEELFGVDGAGSIRAGVLELAHGGTLYLDAIDALSFRQQEQVTRAIDAGGFTAARSGRRVRTEFRLIASTAKDLRDRVESGEFLEDLYFRLNVVVIELPALRHRRQDVPLLVEHFLRESSEELDRATPGITSSALARFARYLWPGNVRELKTVVRGIVVSRVGNRTIQVEDLPPFLQELPMEERGFWVPPGATLKEVERRMIESQLIATEYDRRETARRLGLSLRTLYRRMSEYGIDAPRGTIPTAPGTSH